MDDLKPNHDYQKLLIDDPEDPYHSGSNGWKESNSFIKSGGPVPWHVFRIPFRTFIRIVISLPLGAFLFCVVWALYVDYYKATTVQCTHDKNRPVRNYLPSVRNICFVK